MTPRRLPIYTPICALAGSIQEKASCHWWSCLPRSQKNVEIEVEAPNAHLQGLPDEARSRMVHDGTKRYWLRRTFRATDTRHQGLASLLRYRRTLHIGIAGLCRDSRT